MNWSLVAMMALVLLIIGVIATTIIFFIRHWANRSNGDTLRAENEGTYFVRYTPTDEQDTAPLQQTTTRKNYRKPLQYVLSTAFGLGLLSLLSAATYMNRDNLAAPIELTEQDIAAMSIEQHQWAHQDFQQLPELGKYLGELRVHGKGLILINTGPDNIWPTRSGNLTKQAQQHWQTFAKQHQLTTKSCTWHALKACSASKEDWLYIMLPGLWDTQGIQDFVESGKRLIVYGPPQQVFTNKDAIVKIADLTFKGSLTLDDTDLVLRGDSELTLGFDAGMIIKAQPGFKDFQAESTQPQAISLNKQHLVGGQATTRLYAEAYKNNGRLVWMDFSPNPQDHDEVTPYYLNAVNAAIFRYLGGESYSAWGTWPQGKKFAALMEEDTEDQYHNAQPVAEYFQEKNYPITWFILSNNALKDRELTKLLADSGEIACHGDNHMDFTRHDLKLQQQRIARCQKVLQALTGKTVSAFRPPREAHNQDTLNAMHNNGISHFIAQSSIDRFTPIVYGNANDEAALISLPRMNIDDYTLWGQMQTPDDASIMQLQQETDWIQQIGGLFIFSFHTQYMGDPKHLQTIKDLADYIYNSKAYFATSRDIAQWWRLRISLLNGQHPSEDLLKYYQPTLLTVGTQGKLQRKTINTPDDFTYINQKTQ